MNWSLIYLICAIATALIFKKIAVIEDESFFKQNGMAGVFSIAIIGTAFPVSWMALVVLIGKRYYDTRKQKRAMEKFENAYYNQRIKEEISEIRNKVHDNQ